MKNQVICAVDQLSAEIVALSHHIHENPEIAFTEEKAVGFITQLLKKHGFQVEHPYAGVATAFRATKKGKGPGAKIAFLAEYDALPEIGHACGHNVIAACSTGAFLALAQQMDSLNGELSLIGTPGEEAGGGKVMMLENGGFDGVEYALMMHPSSGEKGLCNRGGRAATSLQVEFFGKAAHSAGPQNGINALNALIATFNHIDMLRPSLHPQNNINGIIIKGGTAENVIPDYACGGFSLRAVTLIELKKLVQAVTKCAETAATLIGARVKVTNAVLYAERYPNLPMCQHFKANMEQLGMEMDYANPNGLFGSSDIGNVSIKIPAIHDYLPLCADGISSHNTAYTAETASKRGDEVCILGAKGLAMTALDIFTDEALQKEIYQAFEAQIPKEYRQ